MTQNSIPILKTPSRSTSPRKSHTHPLSHLTTNPRATCTKSRKLQERGAKKGDWTDIKLPHSPHHTCNQPTPSLPKKKIPRPKGDTKVQITKRTNRKQKTKRNHKASVQHSPASAPLSDQTAPSLPLLPFRSLHSLFFPRNYCHPRARSLARQPATTETLRLCRIAFPRH